MVMGSQGQRLIIADVYSDTAMQVTVLCLPLPGRWLAARTCSICCSDVRSVPVPDMESLEVVSLEAVGSHGPFSDHRLGAP